MMEAPPGAALVMAEADFLLEFLIVALDAPAQLGEVDQGGKRHVAIDGREPEFRGCSFVLGHSISSVSSAKRASPCIGATRTRTRAKRDRSLALLPSRHMMVRQACLRRLRAKVATLTRRGFGLSSHIWRTLTVDMMAAT